MDWNGLERKGVECIERALGKIVLHKPGIEVSNILDKSKKILNTGFV